MQARFYISFVLVLVVLFGLFLFSCTYKKFGEDQDLYLKAKTTTDFVWYKNSNAKLPKTSGSGHSQPLLSTRFNAIQARRASPGAYGILGPTPRSAAVSSQ